VRVDDAQRFSGTRQHEEQRHARIAQAGKGRLFAARGRPFAERLDVVRCLLASGR
jgi:hypothetical protein